MVIPEISEGVVLVWHFQLQRSEDEYQAFAQWLAPDERLRAEAFRFDLHRHRFVVCRATLRQLLGRLLNIPPHEVVFAYNPFGKPDLNELHSCGLKFNVSHCEDEALIAITRTHAVGVDLERLRVLENLESLAQASFSPRECQALARLPPQARNEAFFQTWTRKEAFLKACGTGFSLSSTVFDVGIGPDEPPQVLKLPPAFAFGSIWTLTDLKLSGGYCASVAIAAAKAEVRVYNSLILQI